MIVINKIEDIPLTESMTPPIKYKNLNDVYYLIYGGIWHQCTREVYELATHEILHSKWKKPESVIKASSSNYTVEIESNSSDKKYKVNYSQGFWTCQCKAYEFRRNCSHIEKAKSLCQKI